MTDLPAAADRTNDIPNRISRLHQKRGIVALTGGTGFLGRHIVDALSAAGWRVRALVRRPAAAPDGVEIVPGTLEDEAALERLLDGAVVLVHAAGVIKAAKQTDFMRVNRDGGKRLAARAARQTVPPRIVLVSSLAAREPSLSAYARSKRAEEDAFTAAGMSALAILRPAAIYGPGDRETAVFFKAANGPLLPIPDVPKAHVGLIHVADVAAAVTAFCAEGTPNGSFELTDARQQGYTWDELAQEIRAAVGGRARIVKFPFALFAAVGAVNALLAAIGGHPFTLTPGKARELFHPDWSSAPERQPPANVWQARMPLREGMMQTAHWFVSRRRTDKREYRYAV
jgi:2-alkyl-3-oxoalkanoate reductase